MTYKGYELKLNANGHVSVGFRHQRVYVAKTLGQAKRWVDAYRDGVTWAVLDKLEQDKAKGVVPA